MFHSQVLLHAWMRARTPTHTHTDTHSCIFNSLNAASITVSTSAKIQGGGLAAIIKIISAHTGWPYFRRQKSSVTSCNTVITEAATATMDGPSRGHTTSTPRTAAMIRYNPASRHRRRADKCSHRSCIVCTDKTTESVPNAPCLIGKLFS